MNNYKVYNINNEYNKKVDIGSIPKRNSFINKLPFNITSKDTTRLYNKSKIAFNIKTNSNSKSPILTKTMLNYDSTLSKTDEDDHDLVRFKFLLNKLLKNPKFKTQVIKEIKYVIEKENKPENMNIAIIEHNRTISEEFCLVKKKTISFNCLDTNRNQRQDLKKKAVSFKHPKNVRLIKYLPVLRPQNDISNSFASKLSRSRNKLNELLKSRTSVKSIEVPGLDLQGLTRNDFNSEFIENVDDFSPSWREDCKKNQLID